MGAGEIEPPAIRTAPAESGGFEHLFDKAQVRQPVDHRGSSFLAKEVGRGFRPQIAIAEQHVGNQPANGLEDMSAIASAEAPDHVHDRLARGHPTPSVKRSSAH